MAPKTRPAVLFADDLHPQFSAAPNGSKSIGPRLEKHTLPVHFRHRQERCAIAAAGVALQVRLIPTNALEDGPFLSEVILGSRSGHNHVFKIGRSPSTKTPSGSGIDPRRRLL